MLQFAWLLELCAEAYGGPLSLTRAEFADQRLNTTCD